MENGLRIFHFEIYTLTFYMSIESKIESLLFLSGRPMSVRELAELAKSEAKEIEAAGDKLVAAYKEKGSGLQVIKSGASFMNAE